MKTLNIISFFLLLTGLLFPQQFKSYNSFNKEVELQKFAERGGNVEEISPDIYRLTYIDGTQRVFNFSRKENVNENSDPVDTTIINMWEIDTTQYYQKFSFWQRVNIYNLEYYVPPLVADLNRNNIPEIYGRHNLQGPVEIYERNANGRYTSIYQYDSSNTFAIEAMGEIHGTGEKEVYLLQNNVSGGVVYRSDSVGMLPTIFDFNFYFDSPFNHNLYMNFGDWDNNKITDCVFVGCDSVNQELIIISEFRDSINNFATVYELPMVTDYPSGFAIGDFDNDGKTEIIAGTNYGIIYSIEAEGENNYKLIWQGNFSTENAYMHTTTNDIDGNGKPEFWIGGQDFGQGITRFQCYEADGDNDYKTVAVIELRGINTLYTDYLQAKDIDGDGKEELIMSVGQTILILKFVGSPNNHRYEIYYVKRGEATQPTAEFEPVTLADLDGNNTIDILLPMIKPGTSPIFSYILKSNLITGTEQSNISPVFSEDYISSYPVPFNSTSSIRFNTTKESPVKVRVFNLLGKEIKTLVNERLSPGEYNIQWEAEDRYGNPLPSGIYFICFQTNSVIKTTKTILLK